MPAKPYARFPAVKVPQLAPAVIIPSAATAMAKSIAQLPALTDWLDPDPAFLSLDANGRRGWTDRFNDTAWKTAAGVTNSVNPILGNTINNKPTLSMVGTTLMVPTDPRSLNPSGFSVFAVARAGSNAARSLLGQAISSAAAGDYGPAFLIQGGNGAITGPPAVAATAGTPRIYDAAGGIRLGATNAIPAGTAFLIGFHYSAALGLTITLNGSTVATIADTHDLTIPSFQLFQNRLVTTSAWFGDIGQILVFGTNYLAAERATDLATVRAYLLGFYNLL